MGKLKHVIFACSDAKCGKFLINHWLRSLRANVNLSNIDVVVLDYGLDDLQRSLLKAKGVIVYRCRKDGFVNTLRFRDVRKFLSTHRYDQVLSVDCGDVIFQNDISGIFEKDKAEFRASYEDMTSLFGDFFRFCFKLEDQKKIMNSLKGRMMINVGFLLAPYSKFVRLCDECNNMIIMKSLYGPDQIAADYILHRDGFKRVSNDYNFVITSSKNSFYVKKGEFYYLNGDKISVVHNAGGVDVIRPIDKFGYGPEHNRVKRFTYNSIRRHFKILDFFRSKPKADV